MGDVERLAEALGDIRVAGARKADWWTNDEDHALLAQVLRGECVPWAEGLLASDWLAAHDAEVAADARREVLREAAGHTRTGWQVHGEHVERTNREHLHQQAVIDELKRLLRRACADNAEEDCWFDHNGGCQAHGFLSEPCPYPLIRQYLAPTEAASHTPEDVDTTTPQG